MGASGDRRRSTSGLGARDSAAPSWHTRQSRAKIAAPSGVCAEEDAAPLRIQIPATAVTQTRINIDSRGAGSRFLVRPAACQRITEPRLRVATVFDLPLLSTSAGEKRTQTSQLGVERRFETGIARPPVDKATLAVEVVVTPGHVRPANDLVAPQQR